jgi:hypothetical protein
MVHVPRVIEHYDDLPEKTPEDVDINHNECFICLEIHTNDKDIPIDWRAQQIYIRLCNCGGWVHIQCVNKWYNGHNNCPICRKNMYIFDSSVFSILLHANHPNLFNLYVCITDCLRLWKFMMWLFMATFYIYCFHAMFFTVPSSHNRNLYNDEFYDNIEPNYYYDSENYVLYPLDIDDPEL